MTDLFLKLFNMSIAASWLVLAAAILRFLLRKAPKWIHCVLWGIVGLRLLMPFSIESMFSLIPSAETVPPSIAVSEAPAINSGVLIINQAINPILSDSFAPTVTASVNPMQIVLAVASVVWIVGVVAMTVYAAVSYLRLARRVRPSLLLRENLYACDAIDSPFILGVFRPRIYLPSGLAEEEGAYVIAHEKAHLRRKDHLWKPLGFLLLAVYWFNPALWLAYILLCRDIERACDEKVIGTMENKQKKGYSEALLSCSVHRRSIVSCPLAFGEVGVKERVRSVLNYKKPAFWIVVAAVVACAVLAVCFLTDPTHLDVRDHAWKFSHIQSPSGKIIYTAKENAALYDGTEVLDLSLTAEKDALVLHSGESAWTIAYKRTERMPKSTTYVLTLGEQSGNAVLGKTTYHDGTEEYTLILSLGGYNVTFVNSEAPAKTAAPANSKSFEATVIEANDGNILVLVHTGMSEYATADKISVSTGGLADGALPVLQAGDTVRITYDGLIAESYPAQIHTVYAIERLHTETSPSWQGGTAAYIPSDISALFMTALNRNKMAISATHHIPIHRFESADQLADFIAQYKDQLALDQAHGTSPAFTEKAAAFDTAFFQDNVLFTVASTSRSVGKISSIVVADGRFLVHVQELPSTDPAGGAGAGWLIPISVPRSYVDGCTEFDAILESNTSSSTIPGRTLDEYYDLDATGGLSVFVSMFSESTYRCSLLPTSETPTLEKLLALPTTTIEQMRAILDSYGIDESEITLYPYQHPLSSYIGECDPERGEKVMALFGYTECILSPAWAEFGIQRSVTLPETLPPDAILCPPEK